MPEDTRRIAITGVNGFVGHHLATELRAAGHRVVGMALDEHPAPGVADLLDDYVGVDLTTRWPDVDVDGVIHLAGLAAVGPSFDAPQHYIDVNSSIMTLLGEALVASGSTARVVVVSSGALYDPQQPMPLSESSRVVTSSPYAVSKLLVEHQAAYYRGRGLDCVVARPFNHIGPGQGPGFLVPDLVTAIRARPGGQGPISTGTLTTRRDYTDVRDVARAYRLLVTADRLDDDTFNICSGASTSGEEILAELATRLGVPDLEVTLDPTRTRPHDAPDIVGDASRLTASTGWEPAIPLGRTLDDAIAAHPA